MYNYTPYGVGMSPYQQQLTQNIKEQKQNTDYVLQSDFEQAIEILKNQILELKGVKEDEQKL